METAGMQAPLNMFAVLGASFVGLIIGMIWYHPKVLGTIWMRETGMVMDGKGPNMAVVYGITWVLCFLLAMGIMPLCIHQMGFFSMLQQPHNPNCATTYNSVMADYAYSFRTFRHGALHGFLAGLFIAFPIIAVSAMFERRSWKYIFITGGYWTVVMTIMCAIMCHFTPKGM